MAKRKIVKKSKEESMEAKAAAEAKAEAEAEATTVVNKNEIEIYNTTLRKLGILIKKGRKIVFPMYPGFAVVSREDFQLLKKNEFYQYYADMQTLILYKPNSEIRSQKTFGKKAPEDLQPGNTQGKTTRITHDVTGSGS